MLFMASGDDSIEFAAVQKLQYALLVKKLNDEMLEQLASSLRWLIHYSEVHAIELPEKEKIIALIDRAIAIEGRLPTKHQQPKRTPDDSTKQIHLI